MQPVANISLPTHWGWEMHICSSESDQHLFRWGLVPCSVPSHYLNNWWIIVNWIPGNKFQLNLNQNAVFTQENWFTNITFKMVAISSYHQPQCTEPCKICSSFPLWLYKFSSPSMQQIFFSFTPFICLNFSSSNTMQWSSGACTAIYAGH